MKRIKKGKNFWNSIASEFASDRTKSRKYALDPALFKQIGNVKNKKILDIACGPGILTVSLAQQGGICVGIDYSEKLIKIAQNLAKQKNLNIDFRVMDVREIENLQMKFDLVTIALLLPHLSTKNDIKQVIRNVANVLNNKGRLIVAEPHPSFDFYMRERFSKGNFNYFKSGLPYQFEMDIRGNSLVSEAYHWTLEDYTSVIEEAGLVISTIKEPQLLPGAKIDKVWYDNRKRYPAYIILDCLKF